MNQTMNQQTAVDGRIFVAYQWIPQLVDDINAGLVDHGVLADKLNWQTFILNNYPDVRFNWDEFQHEAFRIDDTAQIHVYVFPEPEDVGQPAFGAVFVRSTSNACAYYTLEMASAGLGIAFHAKPRVVANAKQSINTIGLDGVLYFLGFKDSYLGEQGRF